MVLQKAMKQGRNVHGIPPRDACSDVSYNIKGVWPHWGTCLLQFCVQLHPLFFACSRSIVVTGWSNIVWLGRSPIYSGRTEPYMHLKLII